MDGESSINEFQSLTVTPIAQLSPSLDDANQRYIHATVILLWPFSSATRQFSLLLSEPDFRLRGSRGQVKVNFCDKAAEAVAKSKIGIGDNICLSLDGVEWKSRPQGDPSSDIGIGWDLLLCDRVLIEVQRNSETLSTINLERPSHETVERNESSAAVATAVNGVTTPNPSTRKSWSSPAFARTTDASFSSPIFDRGVEQDGYIFGKGRKRTKFSRPSSDWVFLDTPPSPVKAADISDSEGSGVGNESEGPETISSKAASPISPPHMASPSDGRSTLERHEVLESAANTPQKQVSGPETRDSTSPLAQMAYNKNKPTDNWGMATIETAQPYQLSDPGMPVVSPLKTLLATSTNHDSQSASTEENNTVSIEATDYEVKTPQVLTNRHTELGSGNSQRGHSVGGVSGVGHIMARSESSIENDSNQKIPPDDSIESTQRVDIIKSGYIVSDDEFSGEIETGTLLKEEVTELSYAEDRETSHGYMAEQTDESMGSQSKSQIFVGQHSGTEPGISFSRRNYQNVSWMSPSPNETAERENVVMDDDEIQSNDLEPVGVSYHQEQALSQLPNQITSPSPVGSSYERPGARSPPSESQDFDEFTEKAASGESSNQRESVGSDINMENIPTDISISGLQTDVPHQQLSPIVILSSSASPRSEAVAENIPMGETDIEVQPHGEVSISPTASTRITPADSGLIFDGASEDVISHLTEANLDVQPHQLITPHNTQGSFSSLPQKLPPAIQLDPSILTPKPSQNIGSPVLSFSSVVETTELRPSSAINVNDLSRPQPVDRESNVESIPGSPSQEPRESSSLPERVELNTPETRSSMLYGSEKSETPVPDSSRKEFFESYDTTETGARPRSNTQTSGFRTPFSYFCPLSRLIENFNQQTDTISFVMDTSPISRANRGPKEFYMTLKLTDPSLAGSTTTAQVFRKHKNALPTVTSGDVILLRNFRVQSINRNMTLNSMKDSAWAVFTQGEEEGVKIDGAPVEFGPEERAYVDDLRTWYEKEGAELVRRNQSLQAERQSIGTSSMSPSESGSQSSRGNIFKRHRRPRRSTGSRITVHKLRRGRQYLDLGSPSDKESIHELRDGTVYAHPSD